jgi:predicted metal-binding protein
MSRKTRSVTGPETGTDTGQFLRTYPATWKGQLVLACSKCRKKLKKSGEAHSLIDLKRELKKRSKHDEDGVRIRVVNVSCLKMCPKDAITVCTQRQLGDNQCSILRTQNDIDTLYSECRQHNPT